MPKPGGDCRSTARKPLSDVSNSAKPSRTYKKTARKPLSDVSNSAKPSRTCKKTATKKKKKKEKEEYPGGAGDGSLDRLAAAHTELSNLVGKIDELVLQAFKHGMITEAGSSEVESFICFLTEMQSSLITWIPRFNKVFTGFSAVSNDEVKQSPSDKAMTVPKQQVNVFINNKEEPLDLAVSPSPLVSWRADNCIVESGKQLFLLTPLPKSRAVSSKRKGLSRYIVENIGKKDPPLSAVGLPPLSSLSVPRDKKLEKTLVKVESKQKLLSSASEIETAAGKEFKSPPKFPADEIRDKSQIPNSCLKSVAVWRSEKEFKSPVEFPAKIRNHSQCPTPYLRSLIETNVSSDTVTAPFKCEEKKVQNATPWPRQKNVDNFNKSAKDLPVMYPELPDMQLLAEKPATQRKDTDETFEWFLSPPKTCVLMEPPSRKIPLASTGIDCLDMNITENTPMWKDMRCTAWKDEKVGESTLKKELWTRFEAISAPGARLDVPTCQNTSKKGFLEMLNEAC